MRLGNDTSREILADNFARNRGQNFVQPCSKKWLSHFFDSLKKPSRRRALRSAADPGNAQGADLGREAHGHGPAVFDLHTVAPGEAAGPLGVDQNGLPGAAVADQKLTVPDLQNLSLKDSCLHGFQFDPSDPPILCRRVDGGVWRGPQKPALNVRAKARARCPFSPSMNETL